MSDEIPPAPSETSDDAAKAETIRITLPARPEQPTAKRETVRISLPGKPAVATPLPGAAPKKETTKLSAGDEAPTIAVPPPAGASKPFVPPPPKPPSALGGGAAPVKPLSGVVPPPKPPSLGARPTVPLKPAPAAPGAVAKPVAPAGSGINPPPEPVTQKAAAPKKETARITLPADAGKAAKPQATIKMQTTQPLVKQPLSTQSSIQPAPVITTSPAAVAAEPVSDSLVTVLSIVAVVISLVSLGLVFLAYSASSLS